MIAELIKPGINEKNIWIYKLDPRIKIVLTVLTAVIVATRNNIWTLSGFLLFAFIFLISARLEWEKIGKKLLIINSFIFLIWLVIPWSYPGETLFQISQLTVSREGVYYAFQITLRANTIMLIIISLMTTTTVTSLIHGLKYLYIPNKLIFLLFFVYRYIFVLEREYKKLYESMLVRGFENKTSLHCYKAYAYLLGMLIVRSYERSKTVYEAMICRGFKGEFYTLDDLSLSQFDFFVLGGSIFFMVIMVILEVVVL